MPELNQFESTSIPANNSRLLKTLVHQMPGLASLLVNGRKQKRMQLQIFFSVPIPLAMAVLKVSVYHSGDLILGQAAPSKENQVALKMNGGVRNLSWNPMVVITGAGRPDRYGF